MCVFQESIIKLEEVKRERLLVQAEIGGLSACIFELDLQVHSKTATLTLLLLSATQFYSSLQVYLFIYCYLFI